MPSIFSCRFCCDHADLVSYIFFYTYAHCFSVVYLSNISLSNTVPPVDWFFPLSSTQLSLHHWNHLLIFTHGFGLPWNFVLVVFCRSESISSAKLLLDHLLLNLVLGCIAAADGSSIVVPLPLWFWTLWLYSRYTYLWVNLILTFTKPTSSRGLLTCAMTNSIWISGCKIDDTFACRWMAWALAVDLWRKQDVVDVLGTQDMWRYCWFGGRNATLFYLFAMLFPLLFLYKCFC